MDAAIYTIVIVTLVSVNFYMLWGELEKIEDKLDTLLEEKEDDASK